MAISRQLMTIVTINTRSHAKTIRKNAGENTVEKLRCDISGVTEAKCQVCEATPYPQVGSVLCCRFHCNLSCYDNRWHLLCHGFTPIVDRIANLHPLLNFSGDDHQQLRGTKENHCTLWREEVSMIRQDFWSMKSKDLTGYDMAFVWIASVTAPRWSIPLMLQN